jgi:hypothetical protein
MGVLAESAAPVTQGAVIEFTQDGKRNRTFIVAAAGYAIGGSRAIARSQAIGPDGKPLPPPSPPPSDAQRWSQAAKQDPLLHDALRHFAGRTWPDAYNPLECLADRAKLLGLKLEPTGEVRRLKQTTNWERHSKNWKQAHKKPKTPMSPKDARKLLEQLLRKALT